MSLEDVREAIKSVPDFPKEGILFRDISPVLGNPELFQKVVDYFAQRHQEQDIGAVASIESRGFIFGMPLAYALGAAAIPVRKKGKLPRETVKADFELEYGVDTLEMHADAPVNGRRVLVVDDLLATGGTAAAAAQLVEQLGGEVAEVNCLVELTFLEGRKALSSLPVHVPIAFGADDE